MPFGLNNIPLKYLKIIDATFKEYLGSFMKLFLDDFSLFNDIEIDLSKLQLCFNKCQEFGIDLNLEKCMFLVYFKVIQGYIVSKKRKLLDLKKIMTIVEMSSPKNPWNIQVFNGMECSSINASSRISHGMLGSLWNDQHGCTNFDCILLGFRIPCAFQLLQFCCENNVGTKYQW